MSVYTGGVLERGVSVFPKTPVSPPAWETDHQWKGSLLLKSGYIALRDEPLNTGADMVTHSSSFRRTDLRPLESSGAEPSYPVCVKGWSVRKGLDPCSEELILHWEMKEGPD